ncbi:uncharacterized protein BCR38DRAFT_416570 [Pseudomassariella vexata]|uniref:NmrA-like domain-containing protein n=1 Tax=Pseudomassariella vexata TaxID=1141098 RepID=A0A1Y2EIH0_9PEZI|nr:uncharacterized protein BCR38DRAFT_416570 [Pseudomassariella vexata]ORY71363.1 hypothetical protein BCR38DRAFT_416570 [Pseudomassariella vexata]
MSTPTIFVTGATGAQGGAVARLASKLNWTVHATVRDLDSPSAKSLALLGVELTRGDWDDEAALKKSIAGCDFLFLNLFPDFFDLLHERRQAQGIIRIAKESGVEHILYSSGFRTRYQPDLPARLREQLEDSLVLETLASKKAIEDDTKKAGFDKWTILRPGFFMANLLLPNVRMYGDFNETGVWAQGLLPSTQLPLIDTEDIARFAIAAFQNPEKFSGKQIPLASEVRTPNELMALVTAASGKKVKAKFLSDEEMLRMLGENPFIISHVLMRDMSWNVDIDEVKSLGIPMGTFENYLKREKKAVDETYKNL